MLLINWTYSLYALYYMDLSHVMNLLEYNFFEHYLQVQNPFVGSFLYISGVSFTIYKGRIIGTDKLV